MHYNTLVFISSTCERIPFNTPYFVYCCEKILFGVKLKVVSIFLQFTAILALEKINFHGKKLHLYC